MPWTERASVCPAEARGVVHRLARRREPVPRHAPPLSARAGPRTLVHIFFEPGRRERALPFFSPVCATGLHRRSLPRKSRFAGSAGACIEGRLHGFPDPHRRSISPARRGTWYAAKRYVSVARCRWPSCEMLFTGLIFSTGVAPLAIKGERSPPTWPTRGRAGCGPARCLRGLSLVFVL